MKKRAISKIMMNALLTGTLSSLLKAVQTDDTLDLELRGDSVNIYYRGGSIFKITEHKNETDDTSEFTIFFDTNYCTKIPVDAYDTINIKDGDSATEVFNKMKTAIDQGVVKLSHQDSELHRSFDFNGTSFMLNGNPSPSEAVEKLPFYKQAMDLWLHAHPKYEREFQQVIARENNNIGKISNGTDYFIADIEFADENARFDMVALKWLSEGATRKDPSKVSLALIEVKYGDGTLKGSAGIAKHLADFKTFLDDEEKVWEFCEDMSNVFAQKCQLGLVDWLKEHQYEVTISPDKPEAIFIFANHDLDSTILQNEIKKMNLSNYSFPILYANASYMGYGLYENQMKHIDSLVTKK